MDDDPGDVCTCDMCSGFDGAMASFNYGARQTFDFVGQYFLPVLNDMLYTFDLEYLNGTL